MNFAQAHDIGAWLGHGPAFASASQTAGAEAEIDGFAYDRHAARNRFNSATLIIQGQATLTSGSDLAILANFQDSPNNSDWSDYGDALASTTLISAAGAAVTAKAATIKHTVDLTNARRYVRVQVTPAFAAAGTDTGVFSGVLVFGGGDELPPDQVSPVSP